VALPWPGHSLSSGGTAQRSFRNLWRRCGVWSRQRNARFENPGYVSVYPGVWSGVAKRRSRSGREPDRMPNRYDGVLRGTPPAFGMVHVCGRCQRRFHAADHADRGENQIGRADYPQSDSSRRRRIIVTISRTGEASPSPKERASAAPKLSLALAGHSPGTNIQGLVIDRNSQTTRSNVQGAGRDEPLPRADWMHPTPSARDCCQSGQLPGTLDETL
jgi:hypothetical protein